MLSLFDAALIGAGAFAAGAVNSVAGGGSFFWGATMSRRLPAVWLRRIVIAVALLLTLHYFFKVYGAA